LAALGGRRCITVRIRAAKTDILTAQAITVNAMFTQFAAETSQMRPIDHIDRFTRLALKAQGLCRATLDTLAAIKKPPTVFAPQTNIAHGPQQVNTRAPEEGKPRKTNYWKRMAHGWTLARRARQAQAIRRWRPWARSTGPRTAAGKARSARNADRGGVWRTLRLMSKTLNAELRAQRDALSEIRRTIPRQR
jgi:hypothetical protein